MSAKIRLTDYQLEIVNKMCWDKVTHIRYSPWYDTYWLYLYPNTPVDVGTVRSLLQKNVIKLECLLLLRYKSYTSLRITDELLMQLSLGLIPKDYVYVYTLTKEYENIKYWDIV